MDKQFENYEDSPGQDSIDKIINSFDAGELETLEEVIDRGVL